MEYTNSQMSRLIDEHIHNAKYRDVLKARYIDGMTFEKLAEKHGMSVRQIKTIVYKAREKLFI